MSEKVIAEIQEFIDNHNITRVFRYSSDSQKIALYVCLDFVRFSATYLDHMNENGKIRITYSIYGSRMQESPSYLVTRKKNPNVYDRYVSAWENIKKRAQEGKRIIKIFNLDELENFRATLLNYHETLMQ